MLASPFLLFKIMEIWGRFNSMFFLREKDLFPDPYLRYWNFGRFLMNILWIQMQAVCKSCFFFFSSGHLELD